MLAQTSVAALFHEIRAVRHYVRREWLELFSALVIVVSLIAVAAAVFVSV